MLGCCWWFWAQSPWFWLVYVCKDSLFFGWLNQVLKTQNIAFEVRGLHLEVAKDGCQTGDAHLPCSPSPLHEKYRMSWRLNYHYNIIFQIADAEPGLLWWLWNSFWREPASFRACYKCVWTATSPSSILTSFPPRRVTFRICRVHGGGTDAGMRSSATMSMKPWCTYPHANTCGFTYPKTIAHPDLRRTPSARRACDSPSLCRDGTLRSHRRIGHKTPPIRVEAGISIPPAVNLHIGLATLLHDSPFQRVCAHLMCILRVAGVCMCLPHLNWRLIQFPLFSWNDSHSWFQLPGFGYQIISLWMCLATMYVCMMTALPCTERICPAQALQSQSRSPGSVVATWISWFAYTSHFPPN